MTKTTPNTQRNTPAAARLNAKETLSTAQTQARQFAESCGLTAEDVEDIAQDAILHVLSRNGFGSMSAAVLRDAVGQAIEGEMSRRASRRSEDSDARDVLLELIELEQSILERDLTPDEQLDLANSVRNGWPEGAVPPSANFAPRPWTSGVNHHGASDGGPRFLSLSVPETEAEADACMFETFVPVDESEDWLEDELDDGFVTLSQVRKMAWNHFSEGFDVPRVPDRLVGMAATRAARESVHRRGGVVAVASALLAAGTDPDWGDPLFTPWPFADPANRGRIAQLLACDRRQFAEDLWASAIDTVTDVVEHGLVDSGLRPRSFVPSNEAGMVGHVIWA